MTMTHGEQAKYILELTFDRVANANVTCVKDDGSLLQFKAILHDEIVRARREHLTIDNQEGIIDRQSKRAILLNRDILAFGLEALDAKWHFLIGNQNGENLERYDFSINEPFNDIDTTPYADAERVFSVFYLRRAEELESQLEISSTPAFTFNSWGTE